RSTVCTRNVSRKSRVALLVECTVKQYLAFRRKATGRIVKGVRLVIVKRRFDGCDDGFHACIKVLYIGTEEPFSRQGHRRVAVLTQYLPVSEIQRNLEPVRHHRFYF